MALPNIEMNPPQAHPCSPSWTPLPTPPYHHSGSTQCTRPKHLVLCIEPGLATHFIHDIIHVSMPYFNHRHQFTMFVWESVFSWLAISKKADLCRHNSKWSDLFYSVTGCPGCTSAGSLNLGWLSLPSLLILPNSLTLPHILVPFLALIQFLTCTGTEKKQFGFLVFFTLFDWVAYDRIFVLKVPFRGLLTLMVLFRTLKDKRRVLVLRKGYNIWVGREISWKGMWADEGFCGRQGQCRGLGQQSQWRTWGA